MKEQRSHLTALLFLVLPCFSVGQCSSVAPTPTPPCNLVSSFGYTVGSAGTVSFASHSTGTTLNTSYVWDDDANGGGISHLQNPVELYVGPGAYLVSHVAFDGNCVSGTCQMLVLTGCFVNPEFSLQKTGNLAWMANIRYPSGVSNVQWSWGDGSTSIGLNPSHTYSAAGMFSICVSVSLSCGATNTFCANSSIYRSANSDPITLTVNSTVLGVSKSISNDVLPFIYPNPSSGSFTFQTGGEISNSGALEIYDLSGRLVYQGQFNRGINTIQLANSRPGIYFVRALTPDRTIYLKFTID
jgi:hypothetical protein